jgi:SEC-C motif
MKNHVGRNSPCPCGSGKKYKKCCAQNGIAVLEVVGYGENASGSFMYVPETHILAETGETYKVHIYSSVLELIENNDQLKQKLCVTTHHLLFELRGPDVAFMGGDDGSDDFLIWHNRREQYVMWFTVTQAKSYFGPMYEARGFGRVERQPWGYWSQGTEEAVIQ